MWTLVSVESEPRLAVLLWQSVLQCVLADGARIGAISDCKDFEVKNEC